MELSSRIRGLTGGGPDGWEIVDRSYELRDASHDVIDMTMGEPDRPTDPAILEAMHRSALAGSTGYAMLDGIPDLRAAIAKRTEDRTGVPTKAANVMITPGGQGALISAHLAVLDHADRALFIEPYYTTYPGTIRTTGAIPVPVPARAENGFQPDRAALEAAAPGARSLLINTPNNPTGAVYGAETLHIIGDVCRNHDLWLISDEVYDTQIWQGTHMSPRAVPGMEERTLVIGSLSKSHAMTGSRLGWIIAPEDVVTHLGTLALGMTFGVPGFIQEAGVFALAQGHALEDEIAEPFRRRHRAAQDILAGCNTIRVIPSTATMYLMLDIRASGLSATDFAFRLLEEEKIAVMPGESFGKAAAGHIRMALTTTEDRMSDALHRLITFTESLAERAA